MKKKLSLNLSERIHTLGKITAIILAWALSAAVLSNVDASPSGEQSEHSHEL